MVLLIRHPPAKQTIRHPAQQQNGLMPFIAEGTVLCPAGHCLDLHNIEASWKDSAFILCHFFSLLNVA